MNIETQLNILKNFAEHHHNLINSPSVGNNLEQCLQKKYIGKRPLNPIPIF